MKRFGDFLLVSEEELKKNKEQKAKEDRIAKAKDILKKACLNKEKLAGPNDFMNDPKNDATDAKKFENPQAAQTSPGGGMASGKSMDPAAPKKDVSKDIAYTNKAKKSGQPDPMLMSLKDQKAKEDKLKQPEPKELDAEGLRNFRSRAEGPQGDAVREALGMKKPEPAKKSQGPQSFAQMKKAEAAKKNDPAVSGTKIESQQSGELGNKAKAKDDSVSPLQSEPKKDIAEVVGDKYAKKSEVKKSMKEGGSPQWSQNDLMKGLAVAMGGSKIGATEMPNPSAQPLIPKQAPAEPKPREVPLHRALADMDDSKVKV